MNEMFFEPSPYQNCLGKFNKEGGVTFAGMPSTLISAKINSSARSNTNRELCYMLTYRAVVFIPTDFTDSVPEVSINYWRVPESDNYVVCLQYQKNKPGHYPFKTFYAIYVDFQFEVTNGNPFVITSYLHDEDPETSRGTVTTVQSATPIP